MIFCGFKIFNFIFLLFFQSPTIKIKKEEPPEEKVQPILRESVNPDHPDNSFQQFHIICQKVRNNSSYLAKTELLAKFFKRGTQGTFQVCSYFF